jgi:hypothetical protein
MKPITEESPYPLAPPAHRDRQVFAALGAIIGSLLVWGFAVAQARPDGGATSWLPASGMLLVLLGPVAVMMLIYGPAGAVDACLWLFRRPTPGPAAKEAAAFFQLAAAFFLAGGFLATIITLVMMLRVLGQPDHLGRGMALALLNQVYGVCLAAASIALAGRILRRHHEPLALLPIARRSAGVAGITLIAGSLTTLIAFCMMRLGESPLF